MSEIMSEECHRAGDGNENQGCQQEKPAYQTQKAREENFSPVHLMKMGPAGHGILVVGLDTLLLIPPGSLAE
jgi:hypothetical protein